MVAERVDRRLAGAGACGFGGDGPSTQDRLAEQTLANYRLWLELQRRQQDLFDRFLVVHEAVCAMVGGTRRATIGLPRPACSGERPGTPDDRGGGMPRGPRFSR